MVHRLHAQVSRKLSDIEEDSFAAGQARYAGFRGRYFRCWRVSHLSFPCKPSPCVSEYHDYSQDQQEMTVAFKEHRTENTRFTAALEDGGEQVNCNVSRLMLAHKNGCQILNLLHVWGRFSKEPFTSLALCSSPLKMPFFRNLALPNNFWEAQLGNFVTLPEAFCPAALVHTLSAGGFRGQTASEWLPILIIQLCISGLLHVRWESVELKDALSKIKLPFCGPVDEPWNEHVLDYVKKKCKGFLGTITQSKIRDLGELLTVQVMPSTTTDMNPVIMQCLCKNVKINSDTVTPAVEKLISVGSEFDIFLCSPPRYNDTVNFEAIKKSLKSVEGLERVAILYVTRDPYPSVRITCNKIRILLGDLAVAERFLILLHTDY